MALIDEITGLCEAFDGRIGLSAQILQTGEFVRYQADEIFPTASVIKLPILITLMQQCEAGDASLDEPLMLRRADSVGGSGVLQQLTPGLIMPVRDWAFLMMNLSDNLATNVLIDHVGLENIQTWLAESEYADVRLHRKIDFGEMPEELRHLGTASPDGLTRMMSAVFRREIVSPAASDEMMRMMDKVGADRVGRFLPFSPYDLDEPEEEKLRLAGKTGSMVGIRTQTAAVWRGKGENPKGFLITVMTDGHPAPEKWSVDADGVLVIGRIARAIYDHVMD